MSRFTKSLSIFMAGAALTANESQAVQHDAKNSFTSKFEPTTLRPLNFPGDNLYAAHRSHSSHSSHSSHRSSSSSYSSPNRSYSSSRISSSHSSRNHSANTRSSQPVDPGRPATVSSNKQDFDPKDASLMELIRRVQLALIVQGYAPGTVDGIMGPQTRSAIKKFQKDQGLEIDGLMGEETLNALGIVAKR